MNAKKLSTQENNATSKVLAYQGPIPTPDMLKQYNEIDSNFANRILTMAEENNLANIELNKENV